jgi:D-alanyl-D-alanine carboxypeptidase (penicillin-binding protein 5/6)
LTALLAIEKGTLTDSVTVSQAAINSVPLDAVSAKLSAGEMLTLEDLLYCLLLGSANDAAAVIAEHISGSQIDFVEEMNQFLQQLGCTATQFTNPHGLHDDNQHTTARDSAKILDAALRNPVFRTIFSADTFTVKQTNLSPERILTNGNSMKDSSSQLYYDSRVIGGRTGVTQDGRRCLAAAAESNNMLVISIVMGAESVYQEDGYSAIRIGGYKETTQLFDACLNGYKTAQILHAEQVLRQIPVNGASNDLLIGSQNHVITVLPKDITIADLNYRYDDKALELPISKGEYVSNLQIWYGSMCIAEAQLYAMNDVQSEEMNHTEKVGDSLPIIPVALLIVIGIVVLIAIMYLLLRFGNKIQLFAINIRKKHYRRSHKRER